MTALACGLTLAFALQDPSYAGAESLLQAGDFPAALHAAERVVAAYPCDPQAQLLLGRIHFARPVVGRYAALRAFRAAARLAPDDPEPLYRQMEVGFRLGSDEGDVIAREALLRIFALDADYRDSWERFREVYRNPEIWRRADRALARHPDDVTALARRVELAIALAEPLRAESLLAPVMARRPTDARCFLLRAEASFLAGLDAAGYAWHDSALAFADADSTGALWDEVWMIASPEEAARHARLAPGERRRFFAWFWARRDPNLVTPQNERIPEHFQRLAYARRYFRVLHPQMLWHRSARWRALETMGWQAELQDLLGTARDLFLSSSTDRLAAANGLGPGPRDVGDTAGSKTLSYLAGLDARGLIFVRQGPPDVMLACVYDALRPAEIPACGARDAEGWVYHTSDGLASLGFGRYHGESVFRPISRYQVRSTQVMLASDRTAMPAPLLARGWSAFYTSGEPGRTDVYFRSAPDTGAVVLWDETGEETVRARGPGLLVLTVPPGGYDYGLDVDSAGVQGLLRGALAVPAFAQGDLGLSSLALAPADSLRDREATLTRMPADLVFPAGAPLATYAEVYGLRADAAGRAHYRVRYSFTPVRSLVGRLLGGTAPVVFEFEREGETRRIVPERLVIEPGRVPPGRYRVSLAVTDLRRNVKSESVALEITIR